MFWNLNFIVNSANFVLDSHPEVLEYSAKAQAACAYTGPKSVLCLRSGLFLFRFLVVKP